MANKQAATQAVNWNKSSLNPGQREATKNLPSSVFAEPSSTRLRSPRILRLRTILAMLGISRSSLYKKISQGTFPTKIKLGPRAVGWLEADIDDWIDHQIALSRGGDNYVN